MKKILITGASGLLGRKLVEKFLDEDFEVLAQYHHRKGSQKADCHWLAADFSNSEGVRTFLETYEKEFQNCPFLINNYGPITYKDTADLKSEDFLSDFHHNVLVSLEIINFLMAHSRLESVVNIGFEFSGEIRPYKKILSYAVAKNGLLLITRSLARAYPAIRFNMMSPRTIEGAAFPSPNPSRISAEEAAATVFELITGDRSGINART